MIQFTIKHTIDSLIMRYAVAHRTRCVAQAANTIQDARVASIICRVVIISQAASHTGYIVEASAAVGQAGAEIARGISGIIIISRVASHTGCTV